MKRIGLLGGMSWQSSIEYYRILNQLANEALGGSHSAECVLHSVDFQPIETRMHAGKWDEIAVVLGEAAQGLQAAGAECVVLAANTVHLVADEVAAAVEIPLLNLIDVVGETARAAGQETLALLGTGYTMRSPDLYVGRLRERFGIEVLTPEEADLELIHQSVFGELIHGKFLDATRAEYVRIIEGLEARGARAAILGCTEMPILVKPGDVDLPLLDTTALHCKAIMEFALD